MGAHLPGELGTSEEQSAGSRGGAQGKLIKSDDLTAGLEDAGTGSLRHLQGADGELGDLREKGGDLRRGERSGRLLEMM